MPHSETTDVEIPVIDISDPSPEIAQQVLDAASIYGFLYIKSDGAIIPLQSIADMFNLSKRFFHQPTSQKSTHTIHTPAAGGLNRGWVSMAGESLDPGQKQGDPKEAFNIAPPHPSLQPLPPPLSTSTPQILTFLTACHTLCTHILTLLATALDIPPSSGGKTWFSTRHDDTKGPSGTIFRMLYYPQTPPDTDTDTSSSSPAAAQQYQHPTTRAGAHSDYGSLTLLFRLPGQPGLEILNQSPTTETPTWTPVPVNPSPSTLAHPPILVNIGDLLSFWTNGLLKSTVHRVTFSGGQERYSMAYFCHPLDGVRLEAVPGRVIGEFGGSGGEELSRQRGRLGLGLGGDGDGDSGEVWTAREHLDRRLRVTYGLGG